MNWKQTLGYGTLFTIIGGIIGYSNYTSGYDSGYYRRALEQNNALHDMEARCELRVEVTAANTHQRDVNFCDERLFELQSSHPSSCEHKARP